MWCKMYYTEAKHIPFFKLIFFEDNKKEPLVEFYNDRTRARETTTLHDFIKRLQMIEYLCNGNVTNFACDSTVRRESQMGIEAVY